MNNLWSFNKLNKSDLKSMPHGILQEQAKFFEKNTEAKLYIAIKTRKLSVKADGMFGLATNFEIVAPYLDGYTYTLFTMFSKPENDYPVAIDTSAHEKNEWEIDSFEYTCNSESEFLDALKDILGSEDTTKIVRNLYSKSFLNDEY